MARQKRRGPARCRHCQAPVAWFRSPFGTGRPRMFDPNQVSPGHPLAGVEVFPVLNGTSAWKSTPLARWLHTRNGGTFHEAVEQVQAMPWHRLHKCATETGGGAHDAAA